LNKGATSKKYITADCSEVRTAQKKVGAFSQEKLVPFSKKKVVPFRNICSDLIDELDLGGGDFRSLNYQ
jgi:hypothetical protein